MYQRELILNQSMHDCPCQSKHSGSTHRIFAASVACETVKWTNIWLNFEENHPSIQSDGVLKISQKKCLFVFHNFFQIFWRVFRHLSTIFYDIIYVGPGYNLWCITNDSNANSWVHCHLDIFLIFTFFWFGSHKKNRVLRIVLHTIKIQSDIWRF